MRSASLLERAHFLRTDDMAKPNDSERLCLELTLRRNISGAKRHLFFLRRERAKVRRRRTGSAKARLCECNAAKIASDFIRSDFILKEGKK